VSLERVVDRAADQADRTARWIRPSLRATIGRLKSFELTPVGRGVAVMSAVTVLLALGVAGAALAIPMWWLEGGYGKVKLAVGYLVLASVALGAMQRAATRGWRVTLGEDGITLTVRFQTRVIPWQQVRGVQSSGSEGEVVLELDDGTNEVLRTEKPAPLADAVSAELEGRAAVRQGAESP
jgi:hypothetical protein